MCRWGGEGMIQQQQQQRRRWRRGYSLLAPSSYAALRNYNLESGVLIHAAAGGIGLAAVQIAKGPLEASLLVACGNGIKKLEIEKK